MGSFLENRDFAGFVADLLLTIWVRLRRPLSTKKTTQGFGRGAIEEASDAGHIEILIQLSPFRRINPLCRRIFLGVGSYDLFLGTQNAQFGRIGGFIHLPD